MGVPLGRRAPGAEAMNRIYLDTARLLTRVAQLVLADDTFALKAARRSTCSCATCRGSRSIST
jgi:hypothetical protein